jgi:hypothetical protein
VGSNPTPGAFSLTPEVRIPRASTPPLRGFVTVAFGKFSHKRRAQKRELHIKTLSYNIGIAHLTTIMEQDGQLSITGNQKGYKCQEEGCVI